MQPEQYYQCQRCAFNNSFMLENKALFNNDCFHEWFLLGSQDWVSVTDGTTQ